MTMYYPLGTGCLWLLTGCKQDANNFVSVPQGAKADWHQDIWPSEERARWEISRHQTANQISWNNQSVFTIVT